MPVAVSELRSNFVMANPRHTVAEVRELVAGGGDRWAFVVVPLSAGEYAVLRLHEILEATGPAAEAGAAGANPRLDEIDGLLARHAATAIEQESMSSAQARALLRQTRASRLVVVHRDVVVGVLAVERRGGSETTVQPAPQPTPAPPSVPPPSPVAAPRKRSMVSAGTTRTPSAAEKPAADAHARRWINAAIQGHKPGDPLTVGAPYTLAFDVDTAARPTSVVKDLFKYVFASAEQGVDLTVRLSSDDFDVSPDAQVLHVPRAGRSKGKARFVITPKREGEGVLTAVFLKDGNFVQLVTLKLRVGEHLPRALPATESAGRALDAATKLQPRDVSLVLLGTGTGFHLIVSGAVTAEANLPLTPLELDQLTAQTRQELREIAKYRPEGAKWPIHETQIDIPEGVRRDVLQRLARSGFRLYQRLFFGPAADAQTRHIGTRLRELAASGRLRVQIVTKQLMLPWGVLYLADRYDPDDVDPSRFLGFSHVIEHIPLQNSMTVLDETIDSRPSLQVAVNVNADIDKALGAPLVARQLDYWEAVRRRGATVGVRTTRAEVMRALADASVRDRILYFYCHATSKSLGERGGPDASALVLTGGAAVTLGDLYLMAPTDRPFPDAPLVFINACESAELSPLFYDGFVPYFMSKGARGVIGTECETPALFAVEWATRFFDRFLAGEPLGELFLELRRDFLVRHNNVLGILYAVYCDGDTCVSPALAVA